MTAFEAIFVYWLALPVAAVCAGCALYGLWRLCVNGWRHRRPVTFPREWTLQRTGRKSDAA